MALMNKVFFITGGAKGFGKGFMNAVLERGAKVFFIDMDEQLGNKVCDEMAAKYGSDKVKFTVADVTDNTAFEVAFQEAVATFQHIEVMVNNAGIVHEGAWELMININFNAVVFGTKLATEHMRKDKGGKGGRIINICSIAGLVDLYFMPIYVGTKHAVRAYTASLAVIDGFLEMVQLRNMNGATMLVEAKGRSYQKLVRVDVPNPDDDKTDEGKETQLSRWFSKDY